jgi:hypothetical protein
MSYGNHAVTAGTGNHAQRGIEISPSALHTLYMYEYYA